MAKSFGRDEMDALVGGSRNTDEMAAFRPSHSGQLLNNKNAKRLPNERPDVSTMSAAETAAMLLEKTAIPSSSSNSQRYRTQRVLAHHALAQELSQTSKASQKELLNRRGREKEEGVDGQDSDDSFSHRDKRSGHSRQAQKRSVLDRKKVEPVVLSSRDSHKRIQRYGGASTSSSDSSDNENRRSGRGLSRKRKGSEDDSSSSDDEHDRRRRHLLANRRRQEPELIKPKIERSSDLERKTKEIKSVKSTVDFEVSQSKPLQTAIRMKVDDPPSRAPRNQISKNSSNEGSSSDSDSSSSGDSSSSESSSDEEEQTMKKPLFVPKHKRMLLHAEQNTWEEEETRVEREKAVADKRKMESRALVAKAVAAASMQSSKIDDDMEEESGGANNAPPSDDDGLHPEKERESWMIRELERLLDTMDQMKIREKERIDYERRRNMTDEEVLQQDIEAGRYQAPGSNRQGSTGGKLQRFYHRGAYYMAENEWDKDDIRHKAAEYARAATGDDKIDKSALPEVMQVKGFGFARQNTRYKGLAKEDTTDKSFSFLPLVQKRK